MTKTKPSDALKYVEDDPVCPDINAQDRIINHFEMYNTEFAVICIAFCDKIPTTEENLLSSNEGDIAVFYSVWSYKKGAGRDIVFRALDLVKKRNCTRYVTMSPKTEMAEKFHIRNGAKLIRENKLTNNFEYI